ncbi:MAG: AraC family transcriptional regulator [Eubacteriales bacterium]|nr:AraC family transcriptional regulator [Eubacteriales bacterium]
MVLSDNIKKLIGGFFRITDCGCTAIDTSADIIYCEGSCNTQCPVSSECDCKAAHKNAIFQAERFGDRYIYFCPGGLVFICALTEFDNRDLVLLAGPMMATDRENFISSDLREPFDTNKEKTDKLIEYTDKLKIFAPEKINDISDMLYVMAGYIRSHEFNGQLHGNKKTQKALQQKQINEYIQSIKARMILGINNFTPYPYDKEKQLIYAITTGNAADARRYMNEILGHIFFASADNLNAIKIRAMELTVLISRAALDGGADMNNIYQFNLQYITDFFELDTIEDICFALTEILNKFSEETFRFAEVKHVDLLSRAVSYIRNNYMHKISLNDVADHIYLSPSYLSRIFKEEMKTSFNGFLNSVRIEKSKILLLSEQLSIIEVSELVGFSDQSYFNKVFKKITGLTPNKFREQKRYF